MLTKARYQDAKNQTEPYGKPDDAQHPVVLFANIVEKLAFLYQIY